MQLFEAVFVAVGQHILACPQHALLSQIGIWFGMEHLTEMSGNHAETSFS